MNNIYVVEIRFDYLAHALIFLPYMFLARKAFPKRSSILPLVISGLLAAILCEAIQYPLTYRTFNINDLLANLAGLTLSLPLSLLLKPHP
jgi:glycopeptide antibiotics resistance protein